MISCTYSYQKPLSNVQNFSFFPFCIKAWNNLSPELRNSVSISTFKQSLIKLYRPKGKSIFNISDLVGLKLLTHLRVNLSHLRQHKFRHNFLDILNPICSCNIEAESISHYLLRCPLYTNYSENPP